MDKQIVEMLGRCRLTTELLRDGVEVAVPGRDRGIDLIAYLDVGRNLKTFIARPIQMKAASRRCFSINKKYGRIRGLILAFVWNLADPEHAETYAMTYREAFDVARRRGFTATESWHKKDVYTVNMTSPNAGKELMALLRDYKMTKRRSWRKVLAQGTGAAAVR